ncbi:MAG: type II toxin-antitoxin system RnlB family antitoxin [Blautia sp.]|nr:type II toxin-antitoxin system RnlB family antitoxin [Blautia sp.]
MEKYMYHAMNDVLYFGMVTILDYDTRLNTCLSKLSFPPTEYLGKKIIVDMALKTGMNQYRFLEATMNDKGKIQTENINNVQVTPALEMQANLFLLERMDIIQNSMLPRNKKRELEDYSKRICM